MAKFNDFLALVEADFFASQFSFDLLPIELDKDGRRLQSLLMVDLRCFPGTLSLSLITRDSVIPNNCIFAQGFLSKDKLKAHMEDDIGISDDLEELKAYAPLMTKALKHGMKISNFQSFLDPSSLHDIKLHAVYDLSALYSSSQNSVEILFSSLNITQKYLNDAVYDTMASMCKNRIPLLYRPMFDTKSESNSTSFANKSADHTITQMKTIDDDIDDVANVKSKKRKKGGIRM